MKRLSACAAGLTVLLLVFGAAGAADEAAEAVATVEAAETAEAPVMERLDEHRYRIGNIVVDKKAGSFTLPGKIIHLNEPLEYLAVTTGGLKEYESLLELASDGRNFNLACILIGLDEANAIKPKFQFDAAPIKGQKVSVMLSWEEDGEPRTLSAANALKSGDETYDNDSWVYIGSESSGDGQQFMADMAGTLIGLVHDPFSVIEHQIGVGMGNYGLITGNDAVLPAEGTEISLTVSLVR